MDDAVLLERRLEPGQLLRAGRRGAGPRRRDEPGPPAPTGGDLAGQRRSRWRRPAWRASERRTRRAASRDRPHFSAIISAPMPWLNGRRRSARASWAARPAELGVPGGRPHRHPRSSSRRRRRRRRRTDRRAARPRRSGRTAGTNRTGGRRSCPAPTRASRRPSTAIRPTLRPCSPTCWTQPQTTSSTTAGSMPVRADQRVQHVGGQVHGVVPGRRRCACRPASVRRRR